MKSWPFSNSTASTSRKIKQYKTYSNNSAKSNYWKNNWKNWRKASDWQYMNVSSSGAGGGVSYLKAVDVFGVKIELFDAIIYYFKSACGRGAKVHKTRSTPLSRTNTPLVAAETLRAASSNWSPPSMRCSKSNNGWCRWERPTSSSAAADSSGILSSSVDLHSPARLH